MRMVTGKSRAGVVSVAMVFVTLVAFPGAARAAVGDLFVDSCVNGGAAKPNCAVSPGLTGAWPEVLSPDGRQLYVAVAGNGGSEVPAVLTFDRNPNSGQLTRRPNGCVTKTGSSGACAAASQLDNPQAMVISPDGSSIYVSNYATNAIVELSRAPDGSLGVINECQGTGGPCTAVIGMGHPHSLAVSPDGTTLYARTTQSAAQGQGFGTLLVFTRTPDGKLAQKTAPEGCWSELAQGSCHTAAGISQQDWQMAVTDTNLYSVGHNDSYIYLTGGCAPAPFCVVTQPSSGTVATFGRNANGTLTQATTTAACISNNGFSGGTGVLTGPAQVRCSDGNDGLDSAHSVVASPDGRSVYVGTAFAVVAYSRNLATGALTEQGCVRQPGTGIAGCTDAAGLGDVYRMAVTPDGGDLIADSNAFAGFAVLKRDLGTGVLSQRAGTKRCITATGSGGACDTLDALGGYGNVVVSSDSRFVYLAANAPGTIATLHRDFAPSCDDKTISVPYQTSVLVPLTCSDRNGDPLSLAIASQPFNGSLGGGGAIDPGTNTVRYNPPLGFSGGDSFTYTATGQGVISARATVTLNVAAPPVVVASNPPPPPPGRISVTLGFAFSSSSKTQTKFTSMTLKGFPSGSTITVTCIKGTCPSSLVTKKKVKKKTKLVSKPLVIRNASGTVKLSKVISKALRAGARLRIDVTRAGMIGATKILEVGKRKAPKVTTQCLPVGSSRPQSSCS
jgi:hypothetical protein